MANEEEIKLDPETTTTPLIQDIYSGKIALDPEPKSIFQRIGEAYHTVTDPVRERVAAGFERPMHPITVIKGEPTPPPSALSRFLAGVVVPTTPTQAALTAIAPATGGITTTAAAGRPLLNAILGGLARTGVLTGAGATTSALTGESPIKGALEGVATGLIGESVRGIKGAMSKDITKLSPGGLARLEARFGVPTVNAITRDLPILASHIRAYDDLLTLKDPTVVSRIGREIYQGLHSAISTTMRGTTITFPYLRPGWWGNLPLPPEVSEILHPLTKQVFKRAGNLDVNTAMKIIKQLKALGYGRSKGDAIGSAARTVADSMERGFVRVLRNRDPRLADMYRTADTQYRQLKGLQKTVTKHSKYLFPGAGETVGYNPVAWREALRDMYAEVPENLFPRLHNLVSFGGLSLGAGATTSGGEGIASRAYTSVGPFHLGAPLALTHPKVTIPSAPPLPPWLSRSIPPVIISGTESTMKKRENE